MKLQILTTALISSAFCHAQLTDAERIQELENKLAELQKEKPSKGPSQEKVPLTGKLFDKTGKLNVAISDAVLVIEGDQSVGTGFLVAEGGKTYVYTAAHVLSGNSRLQVRSPNGSQFKKFGPLEAAEGADLVRLELLEEATAKLELYSSNERLPIHTKVAALGNGGGTGVVAVEPGEILGISSDLFEVSSGIIQGNSGGPIIDIETGKVVGVATHLSMAKDDEWSKGTRQGEVRRFACRVDKPWEWKTMPIGTFLANARALDEFDKLTEIGIALATLDPTPQGMRVDLEVQENRAAVNVLMANEDHEIVKYVLSMNTELNARKTSLSNAELKKKFQSVLSQAHTQATRSSQSLKPQHFAWFHRKRAETSISKREWCIQSLRSSLDKLK